MYLKTEKDLCQNTLIRYMKALKKITNRCIANDWIHKDPFAGIKFREEPSDPEFLTIEKVNRIYECEPGSRWLEVVRDMFRPDIRLHGCHRLLIECGTLDYIYCSTDRHNAYYILDDNRHISGVLSHSTVLNLNIV